MLTTSKQNGFVVISVLLITTISTMVALSAVSESRLQERIAGNQIKQLNARTIAEQGMFDSLKYIKSASLTRDAAEAAIQDDSSVVCPNGSNCAYSIEVSAGTDADALRVVSTGTYQGASASLQAEMLIIPGEPGKQPAGIVACEGITISASGSIDSFDSRLGIYGSTNNGEVNISSEADIISLSEDSSINISGGDPIQANVTAAGDVTVKDDVNNENYTDQVPWTIKGSIAAVGTITLDQSAIAGNVSSGDSISITGGRVGDGTADNGNVSSGTSLTLGWGAPTTTGEAGTDASGSVTATEILETNGANKNDFSTNITQSAGATPVLPTVQCDGLDIATALPGVPSAKDTTTNDHRGVFSGTPSGNVEITFTETSATGNFIGSTTEEPIILTPIADQASTLWTDEGTRSVYYLDTMTLEKTMITIVGDVTIMVDGNVDVKNGSSNTLGFKFADNDTNSSLTLLTTGTVDISSNASVFSNATINSNDQKVPLTIYSSFDSGEDSVDAGFTDILTPGITMAGDTNTYAKVYAPLANIVYSGSGKMTGSIQGRNILVTGDGGVHYDKALADFDPLEGDPTPATFKFSAIYDYYR